MCRGHYPGISEEAPLGYCTLREQGAILECNHTFEALLGESHGSLIGQQLTKFIDRDDQDIYYQNRKKFLESGVSDVCEMRMRKKGEGTFRVHLKASSAQDAAGRQVSLVVITSMLTLDQTLRGESAVHALKDSSQGYPSAGRPGPGLSRREREVLYLVGRGQKSREIAEALGISSRTVDSHRQKIMEKLGISNAAGLVKFAIEHGLEPPRKR
jgi:PAS domain S-box-containing protein